MLNEQNEKNTQKHSKLTLIIDGNWLWMSRLSVLDNKYRELTALCQDLKLMIIKSINIVLRQFPEIDNVIFVADGGSWRTQVELPKFMVENAPEEAIIEYKGTRKLSTDIDWDTVWAAYEEFLSMMSAAGITTCRENGLEGDDFIYHWSRLLNSQSTNVIIWTKDNDLKQLVHTSKNKCFTVWWNKDNGVFTDEHQEGDMDFFFNTEFNVNEDIMNKVIDHAKKVTVIDPHKIVVEKIMRGDGSDNIWPVFTRHSKNNSGKKFKISTKDMNYDINLCSDDEVRDYFTTLLSSKNYVGRVDESLDDIMEHFHYNRTLVMLDESSYPEDIINIMSQYKTYNCNKNINEVESQIHAQANRLNGILDII